jgi:voltage-gated potassium channel Kch
MADLTGDEEAAGGLRWRVPFVAAAVAALVLGYWGLLRYAEASPDYGTGVDDLVYWDLQLFVLGSEPAQDGGDIPWMLQVARFLAPLATLSALLLAARALFSSQLMRLRAQRSRHHTVVIGTEPPAAVLTRELLDAGDRVVVVTSGRGAGPAAGRSPAGALVVAGDARADDVLRRAGTPRARDVMAVTSDSVFNAEVALAVRALAQHDGATVGCHAEISDRRLCAAMVAATRSGPVPGDASPVTFFSRHDRAARDILERSPLVRADDDSSLLIAGGGPLAQAVLAETARLWDQRARRGAPPLPVTVLDPDGDVRRQLVLTPLPAGAVDLEVRPTDAATVTTAVELSVGAGGGPARAPAFVFVCLEGDDEAAIRFGLTARDLVGGAEVVVAVTTGTVFGEVLGPGPGRPPRRLALHNVTRTVYASGAVRRDLLEDMARATHSAYVAAARARGETRQSNPSMVPWDDLGDDLRAANVAQAQDVERKLAAIGWRLTPAPAGAPLVLTDDDVERLARMEHDRWADERRSRGWAHGQRRDNEAKLHPDLVAWSELSGVAQDKDRDAVREIPGQLTGAGLGVVPLGDSGSGGPGSGG